MREKHRGNIKTENNKSGNNIIRNIETVESEIELHNNTIDVIEEFINPLADEFNFYYKLLDMRELEDTITDVLSGQDYLKSNNIYLKSLSEAEYEYLMGLKNTKNMMQWIAGRYSAKAALSKLNIDLYELSSIDLLKGADSAPYLMQYPEFNVSITHSFPYCIGVVSKKGIGIDLEKIFELSDAVVKRFFSIEERELLNKIKNDAKKNQNKIMYWTRKEAVSKFFRLGMKMNFKILNTSEDELVYSGQKVRLYSNKCKRYYLSIAVEL